MLEDPTFDDTRESNFLKDIIAAYKEKNVNNFRAAVTKFKTYCDMDKWKINMFTKIMNHMENQEESYI